MEMAEVRMDRVGDDAFLAAHISNPCTTTALRINLAGEILCLQEEDTLTGENSMVDLGDSPVIRKIEIMERDGTGFVDDPPNAMLPNRSSCRGIKNVQGKFE
nr:hypothetical protein [Candidatus Igneacidithiobacillus taiwanensis]